MQIELTIKGRPVPWARAGTNTGRHYTPAKQAAHRKAVAREIKIAAADSEIGKFHGPVYLQVLFVYGKEPGTWMRLVQMESMGNYDMIMPFELGEEFHVGRPDLDNLKKQIFECVGDSGVLSGEDGQISMVIAAKLKR